MRDPGTMEVSGFGEGPRHTVGDQASSYNFNRRLAGKSNFVHGSNSGLPFLPADLQRRGTQASAGRMSAPTESRAAAAAVAAALDFGGVLLNTPPGFSLGLPLPPEFHPALAAPPTLAAGSTLPQPAPGPATEPTQVLSLQSLLAATNISLADTSAPALGAQPSSAQPVRVCVCVCVCVCVGVK